MQNTKQASTNRADEPLDRRQRRTRAALRSALMALMVEKGFDAISVADIAERADVSRAAFYMHYKDKEELLFRSMKDIYDELVSKSHTISGAHDFAQLLLCGNHEAFCDPTDFEHVAEHKAFYRILVSERGVASFVVQVRKYLAGIIETHLHEPLREANITPLLPPGFIAHAIAGAEIGVISWWLEHGDEYSPMEISRMFYHLMAFGMWRSLGADVPAPTDFFKEKI